MMAICWSIRYLQGQFKLSAGKYKFFNHSIFILDGMVFTITQEYIDSLRNNSTLSVTVEFMALDSMNATSVYAPSIYYCGCAQTLQCDYSSISEDGATDGGNVLIFRIYFSHLLTPSKFQIGMV